MSNLERGECYKKVCKGNGDLILCTHMEYVDIMLLMVQSAKNLSLAGDTNNKAIVM